MSRNWIAAGILTLGLAAAPAVFAADVLPTTTSSPVSFNFGTGLNIWTVAISGCNETSGGSTVTGDCSNEQVVGVVSANGSLALTYQSLAGSSLLNTTVTTGPNTDLGFTEVVTAPSGRVVNAVTLGLTGATASTLNSEPIDIKSSMTDTTPGQVFTVSTNMSNGSSPFTVTQNLATPVNSLNILKDLGASNLHGTSGDAVSLNTVTQTFNVPEPASIALLTVGIGGLLGARRRRARAAS